LKEESLSKPKIGLLIYMKTKKPKLRILFLYDFPLWGTGSANFLRHVASQLVKDKFRVAICAPETENFHKAVSLFTARPPQIPVFIAHPRLKKAKKYQELTNHEITAQYHAYLTSLLGAIDSFKPNIIHVNHLALICWVARYAKSLTGIKYIITSHGSDLSFLEKDRRFHLLTYDALRGASQIMAVSGDVRARLIKMFGKEFSKKLRTIPDGIDLELFPEKLPIKILDKKYPFLKDKPMVLFSGRLIKEKGVEYLVRAAKNIKGEVFIVGDGPERKPLMELAKSLGLKNVHFPGYLGERHTRLLKEFYYRSDVFVAPSVWEEALGIVILEAMACKTPVVVTRRGGIPLAVKEKVSGLFVRPRNAHDIAEKVNFLLADPKLRDQMGENARKIVRKKFTWEKITKKFEYIYQKQA
jgi:glycosyltransferase involved in cell wall biosynthesis